jgi:hypothetical protein
MGAVGLLHGQGVPVSDRGENETGWECAGKERDELPPTQIGRALQELGITLGPGPPNQ